MYSFENNLNSKRILYIEDLGWNCLNRDCVVMVQDYKWNISSACQM